MNGDQPPRLTRLDFRHRLPAISNGWRRFLVQISLILLAVLLPDYASAHERWILTPEQAQEWSSRAAPDLWSQLTWINGAMIGGFLIFTVGWIRLGFTGARELFPDLQARLGSFGYLVAPILRFCLHGC